MAVDSIIDELRALGSEGTKRILMNHGAAEPCLGVKIEELQKIRKRIKKDHAISLALYESGIYDAMYLAGLVADDAKMTKEELRRWARTSRSSGIAEYTVPWVAAEGKHGWELALEWIESDDERVASSGWTTLSCLVALKPDDELDLKVLSDLTDRIRARIHDQPDRVRYTMNGFLISLGSYVVPLTEQALATAKAVGVLKIGMGKTACKVPDVAESIEKIRARGALGKKRKTVKC